MAIDWENHWEKVLGSKRAIIIRGKLGAEDTLLLECSTHQIDKHIAT
jgi:hypothetical protein